MKHIGVYYTKYRWVDDIELISSIFFSLLTNQIRNFSTLCKIEIKRQLLAKNLSTKRLEKSFIRGFTRHYWFDLISKHQRNEGNKSANNSKGPFKESKAQFRVSCDICDQTFANIGNLNRHKKLHSKYNRLQCSVCKETYANISNFKIHIPRHYPTFGVEITYNLTTDGAKRRSIYSKSN